MSLDMTIRFNKDDNILVFIPEGDVDIYTSSDFKEQVLEAFEQKKTDILIDGQKLEFIDSTGLGSLISILKKVKEQEKKIYISNIKPNIKKLFIITELDKLFIIRGEGNE